MNRRTFIKVVGAAPVVTVAGCAGFDTGVDLARGTSAVLDAERIHSVILDYIDGDEDALAALDKPAAFFKRGLDTVLRRTDTPVVELFERYPTYMMMIEANWRQGKNALAAYAERSGKPVPEEIVFWRDNAEAGWQAAKKAKRLNDYAITAASIVRLARPLALLVA